MVVIKVLEKYKMHFREVMGVVWDSSQGCFQPYIEQIKLCRGMICSEI